MSLWLSWEKQEQEGKGEQIMQDRFKYKVKFETDGQVEIFDVIDISFESQQVFFKRQDGVVYNVGLGVKGAELMQCTGLKDKNGKLIYESDIIVIPNQYPFYDYKNKEDMKQDINSTEGEIKGESILNYIGIVEWIYSQWQYVYHCVNPKKQGISEGVNKGLNDFGFDETTNTCYEVIGNIYENPELLKDGE